MNIYYLENGDTEEFEQHLLGILNQVEVFEKALCEESEDSDLNNLEELFIKIKNNSLKTDNFRQLLVILQKMYLMSSHFRSSDFWFMYENFCNKIVKIENLKEGF